MVIDNEKFIGLLVENSGIEKEKVEKYLEELINEIKAAFDEGEGYEIDGFGIFSKLGANIIFIPSEELETEINYKYVGMEPITLPGGSASDQVEELSTEETNEENPIQGILDGPEEPEDDYEDPFAELLSEDEEVSNESEEQEIESVVEEEIENESELESEFDGSEEDQIEEDSKEIESVIDEDQETEDESIEDIFGEVEEDHVDGDEEAPGPDKWGIDAHKEEDQEGAFSGLLGDADSELVDEEDIFASDDEIESEEEELGEELESPTLEDEFEDPFLEAEEEETESEEDFVPVVTNVSSEPAVEEEDSSDNEIEKESQGLKRPPSAHRKQNTPVFLYLVLALVVLAGSGYLLAYFGVVNIQGITPVDKTQIAQTNPVENEQQNSIPEMTQEAELPVQDDQTNSEVTGNEETTSDNDNNVQTPPVENESAQEDSRESDLAPLVADEKSPGTPQITSPSSSSSDTYGLTGTASEAGNNGYTIVLYTLSRKSGADAQFNKLSNLGYRVIIKERPSDQYGVLYRVSIGQFESLANAAVAAEKVDAEILGNYIIVKI
jgi:hypothetical protein